MEKCVIRKLYCGDEKTIPRDTQRVKYSRMGSRTECLKKGFGMAVALNNKKSAPPSSLQNINYIGPVYEANFIKKRIKTIQSLVNKAQTMTKPDLLQLLNTACTKKDNRIDHRAVNSIILFLHDNAGIPAKKLPSCKIIIEK
jgi:hypothetical protein